jgi:hypothetical protein
MKNRKNFWDVMEHLHHVDIILKAFHYTNDPKSHSGFSVQILILVLFISISPLLLILNFLNKNFNMGQCIYLMLVLILSVEIIIYTMLVGSIKARFMLLKAYLEDKKSESLVIDIRGLFSSPILPCFREISMIYDEMLEVISVLNESFSILLSFTLSKYFRCNFEHFHKSNIVKIDDNFYFFSSSFPLTYKLFLNQFLEYLIA